jgi:hypothetical protein
MTPEKRGGTGKLVFADSSRARERSWVTGEVAYDHVNELTRQL